jgi:hypothetical protein
MRGRKPARFPLLTFALIAFLAGTPAYGDLIWDQEILVAGQGLAQDNILSFKNEGTESGCVKWTGSSSAFGAPCPGEVAGDPYTWNDQDNQKSTTFSLSKLATDFGITSADMLGIVFNPSEPGNADNVVTLNALILTFYSGDGSTIEHVLWTAGPESYCCNNSGNGGAGQVFRIDWDQAQLIQQTWFTGTGFGDNRIGVSAILSGADSSNDRFYPVRLDPQPVPEPASFLTMGSGLFALGLLLRRHANRS